MARETAFVDKALAGAVGLAAGAVVGTHVLRRYRRDEGTAIVCTECGESLPVDDVLDPTVTCSCVAPRDSHGFW
ncbi:hypothetical protein M0R88_13275 [Halorussus gelatinilyticus]|uniref:Uncharacterized protein n=1 Tax=Halorussus gelatinilyticus TaxID=2937524 RepID=A0A8U0IEI8_9EURY|nr:hypothetical protein [Halorussus gelatinilyticus]UPV99486.1 hypothetical protein M0R88_13275 [Halorussus gelatinilyticus]